MSESVIDTYLKNNTALASSDTTVTLGGQQ